MHYAPMSATTLAIMTGILLWPNGQDRRAHS
jgi:hypothetical protein